MRIVVQYTCQFVRRSFQGGRTAAVSGRLDCPFKPHTGIFAFLVGIVEKLRIFLPEVALADAVFLSEDIAEDAPQASGLI